MKQKTAIITLITIFTSSILLANTLSLGFIAMELGM